MAGSNHGRNKTGDNKDNQSTQSAASKAIMPTPLSPLPFICIATSTAKPRVYSLQRAQCVVELQRFCNRRCSFCPKVVVVKAVHGTTARSRQQGGKVEFVDLALRWESGRENTNAENSVMWSCLPNKQTNKRSSRGKGRSRSNKECSKQSNHANALVSLPPSTHTLPQAQPNHLCTYSSVCSVLLSFSASAIAAAPSAPRLLS